MNGCVKHMLEQPVIRIILTIIIRIIPVLHVKLKTNTFRCFDYIFPDLLLSSLTHFFLPFHLLTGLHQSSENGISFKGTWHSGDKCTDMELSFTHQEGKQQASACELSPALKLECRWKCWRVSGQRDAAGITVSAKKLCHLKAEVRAFSPDAVLQPTTRRKLWGLN